MGMRARRLQTALDPGYARRHRQEEHMRVTLGTTIAAALITAAPGAAHAFCGFYVSGAGADLFNNATQVVLMREGKRTVLSMQNNYQGPPESFAMVVPVPVVLQEENVKTLKDEVFDRVDALAAPRLVEYWEQDPCAPQPEYETMRMAASAAPGAMRAEEGGGGLGVTIEAQFTVGEYQIVILSARDSTGLDTWLRQEKYQIPAGAEPLLRPYVQSGMKFFVAKVDVKKVKFQNGQAMLSPLRFHYDSPEFSLPVRLGMINSAGTQDLIVHILARGQRYEVANYPNATIPTNLDVKDEAKKRFGEFYAALFDRTLQSNPGAVITEYAWDASSCDPCPTPALTPDELATLGYDVLYTPMPLPKDKAPRQGNRDAVDELLAASPPQQQASQPPDGFVLTRLHARYGKGALGDDLVFRAAQPLAGGREVPGNEGKLEQGAQPSSYNNFQGRYAIRHAWTGPVACASPRRGIWGGPPGGGEPPPMAATELAFAPRNQVALASIVAQDVPEIGVKAGAAEAPPPPQPSQSQTPPPPAKQGKGCQATPGEHPGLAPLAGLLLLLLVPMRRRARLQMRSVSSSGRPR
jgi:MYXO-CTERM domain-containing protein